jgi:hypothetical protein
VHRPLLHRLGVGIAKVKIAGKEEFGHATTIAPEREPWQAVFFSVNKPPYKTLHLYLQRNILGL